MKKLNPGLEILDPIPVTLSPGSLKKRFRLKDGRHWDVVRRLIDETQAFVHARAVFRVGYVTARATGTLTIDHAEFNSRVLQKNLQGVERVFPFAVTIGDAVSQRAEAAGDLVQKYYLDAVGNAALAAARRYLKSHLQQRFALKGMSFMSPGSLTDWPIEAQEPLFSLLGGRELPIGVRLSERMLMLPLKSVSGIYFPTEVPFYSCQLCPREVCPGRKAAYSPKKAAAYGVDSQKDSAVTRRRADPL